MNTTDPKKAEQTLDIPPTDPIPTPATKLKKDGTPRKKPGRKPKSATAKAAPSAPAMRIDASDLVPDIGSHASGIGREVYFWVGLMPQSPVEHLTLAGVRVSKNQERIVPNPTDPRNKTRVPVKGGIARMTVDKFRRFAEQLSRTVFRFHEKGTAEEVRDEPGTGVNVGDVHVRARRGYPIQIPSETLIRERKEAGRGVRPYQASNLDEAAASYIWAVPCQDQDKPFRENSVPSNLTETGLQWPE